VPQIHIRDINLKVAAYSGKTTVQELLLFFKSTGGFRKPEKPSPENCHAISGKVSRRVTTGSDDSKIEGQKLYSGNPEYLFRFSGKLFKNVEGEAYCSSSTARAALLK